LWIKILILRICVTVEIYNVIEYKLQRSVHKM